MVRRNDSGIALLMVIFIIVGVALIAAPLAYTMLAHEGESLMLVDSSRSYVGVQGAQNHAINSLYLTCGDRDATRRTDGLAEFNITDLGPGDSTPLKLIMQTIDEEVMNERASWGATVTDMQSRINLNSITPLVCRNLLGRSVTDLINYRTSGDQGTYRLLRTVYEARSLGLNDSETEILDKFTSVWSGSNTYGYYFSAPIPAKVDNDGMVIIYTPDIPNRIAPGMVIRMLSGNPPDYRVSYSRIMQITATGSVFNMITQPVLQYADECLMSIEIPRPVNVNTAPVEVLVALFKGIGIVGGSELSKDDAYTFVKAILDERRVKPIEGHLEMNSLIIKTFGEGTDKTMALMKAIAYPSRDLYELTDYTAPLCYNSEDIYEIAALSYIGGQNSRTKANDDITIIASVTPPGENSWSFLSQYDWQHLLNCGFGPYCVSAPNPQYVVPPEGYIFDIAPYTDEESDDSFVMLKPETVFKDDYTLFLATFDTGTVDEVFDAYSRDGDGTAKAMGLDVTEDPADSSLSVYGVRIEEGTHLSYPATSNIPWHTSDSQLKIAQPCEIEMWIRLADDWVPTEEQIFFDLSSDREYENNIRLWWKPPNLLVLTICDAGLETDRAHYIIELPDQENYVEFWPGANYHLRIVYQKTLHGYMAIFIDGKKLPGYFSDDEGLTNPLRRRAGINDGVSSRISNYTWMLPPRVSGGALSPNGDGPGDAQQVDVDGSLLSGRARTVNRAVLNKDDGKALIILDNDPNNNLNYIPPSARKITVQDVSKFPDTGVLCWKQGTTLMEYIKYNGKDANSNPNAFLECERGYSFTFDSYTVGSTAQQLPAGSSLYLINVPVDNNNEYPPHGLLWCAATEAEIRYMGKANIGAETCFILDASLSNCGLPDDEIPVGSQFIQIFFHTEPWFAFQKDMQLTVIDNEQQKEFLTLDYVGSNRLAFDRPASRAYYVTNPGSGLRMFARVLLFPSGELPTVCPTNFSIGSDKNGNSPFNGFIDDIKIIDKREDDPMTMNYQPHEIFYGRYVDGNGDADKHYVIANPWTVITEEATPPLMKGECFGLIEGRRDTYAPMTSSQQGNPPHHEVVFMVPTENNPDQPPKSRVVLQEGTNSFLRTSGGIGIRLQDINGFPSEGYVLVQGTYKRRVTLFTGAQVVQTVGYHAILFYESLSGDSLQLPNQNYVFRIVDDTPGDVTNLTGVILPDQAELYAALISTEVKFEKRGALWTEKNDVTYSDPPSGFAEGARIMCLRYPFGTRITNSIDPDSEQIEFANMPFRINSAHFEFGRKKDNNLSVVGCDFRRDSDDRKKWDVDFHGCFGTRPNSYASDAVATMIPVRFADRGKEDSNSRYLRYLALQTYKPGMRIKGVEWEELLTYEELRVRVLMRVDNSAAWDSDPGTRTDELREFISPADDRFDITAQGDNMSYDYFPGNFVEFRIFFEWKDRAYSESNAWKECAKLKRFRMYYERPTQVLSSKKSVY